MRQVGWTPSAESVAPGPEAQCARNFIRKALSRLMLTLIGRERWSRIARLAGTDARYRRSVEHPARRGAGAVVRVGLVGCVEQCECGFTGGLVVQTEDGEELRRMFNHDAEHGAPCTMC